jgi:hypothetical protein
MLLDSIAAFSIQLKADRDSNTVCYYLAVHIGSFACVIFQTLVNY